MDFGIGGWVVVFAMGSAIWFAGGRSQGTRGDRVKDFRDDLALISHARLEDFRKREKSTAEAIFFCTTRNLLFVLGDEDNWTNHHHPKKFFLANENALLSSPAGK